MELPTTTIQKKHLLQVLQMVRVWLSVHLSFEEAKTKLRVDRDALFNLIRSDVLQYQYQENSIRVVENSALDFSAYSYAEAA